MSNFKLLFAIFIAFTNQGVFAQNFAVIHGNVQDVISSQPIVNAEISIYYHNVTYSNDGQPIIGKNKDAQKITTVFSDPTGAFSANIPLRHEQDYVFMVVQSANQETVTKNLIKLQANLPIVVSIALTPLSPTKEEEQLIENASLPFYEAKEQDKMKNEGQVDVLPVKKKVHTITGLSASESSGAACSYSVPTNVFVSNLHNGYNGTSSGSGYTGYIDFDLYVGGVVHGEIGGITTNLDTKKAQAVAARTFSLNRHEQDLPVNIGQAYHDTPTASSSLGASESSEQVILYNNQVIDAKYSARCNGDYTQHATEGTWSPYVSCNTSGNEIPYLQSVSCSGHVNCSQTNETPCCNASISTTGNLGYIYGHGVGMCQRGIEQFGELFNWTYCQILTHYYTDVCIANTSCEDSSPTLICENAFPIVCGEVFQGSSSNASSNVYSYGCNSWTETGPERVHEFVAPYNGRITASINNFTGDLDVYLLGSCDPNDCLGTVYSSEVVFENAMKDSTYYLVVDADDGSGSAYDLLLTCTDTPNDIDTYASNAAITLYPNPTHGLLHFNGLTTQELIVITNIQGKIMLQQQTNNQMVDVSNLEAGMYFVSFPLRLPVVNITFLKE